jgi:hypothetical protein
MNPETDGELDTFGLLQILIQVSHGSMNSQTSPYCSLRIILMGLRIAKIHQQSITQELGNMSVKMLDDFRTRRLIGTDDFSVVFWVKLRGECGGLHQVAEHDGQLATFSVW